MIAKVRLQGTVNNTVSDQFHQARKAGNGESFWRGVAGGVADVLIVAHREKIAAGLRRAGFEIGDDDVLSEAVIVAMVAKKTEIDISSFDGEEISQKVMQYLSKIISEKIGVSVDLSLGFDAMIEGAAKSAIASGRVNQLIG